MTLGPKEERLLLTGLHTVTDIYCTNCNTVLGWKYVSCSQRQRSSDSCQHPSPFPDCQPLQEQAFEEREKYKEGKFIVEKAKVMKVCR